MSTAIDGRNPATPRRGPLFPWRTWVAELLIAFATALIAVLVPHDRLGTVFGWGCVLLIAVLVVSARPVRSRLPSVALLRGGRGDGFDLRFRPSAGSGS